MSSASRRVRRQLAAYERGADLDYDEQEELAIKVRYGLVRAQLEAMAESAPANLPPPAKPIVWRPPPSEPKPVDPQLAAKAIARFGRGHMLGRSWRR